MPEQNKLKFAVLLSVVLLCGLSLAACSGDSVDTRMARASTYLDSGELRAAEIELKNVLQKQPENAQAWWTLGKVSLTAGRFADAAEQFQRAREHGMPPSQINTLLGQALIGEGSFKDALEVLDPNAVDGATKRAKILALQGKAYLGLEKNREAGEAFDAALAAQPDYPAALVGQARLAQVAGKDERAQELLAQAIAADPDYGPAWAEKGSLAFRQRRCEEVVEVFDKIQTLPLEALPPAPVFLSRAHAAHCLLQMDKIDQAAASVDVLMEVGPEHPYANYLQALVNYERENYDQATVHLQRVLAAAPGHVQSLILMGAVKAAQDDLASAKFYFTDALSRAPDNLRARELLASVYVRQGHPEQAVEILREALSEHGSDPGLLALLAEASAQSGNRDAALGYLNDSARQAGSNPDLQLALALGMARAGDTEGALAQLEQMNLEDGEHALKAALLRIALYLQRGESEQAVSHAEALAADSPEDVRVLRWLARVYVAVGRDDDARSTLQQAIETSPEDAGARLDLGLLELSQANYESADRMFRAVLDTHPDNVRAMLALEQSASRQGDPKQATAWLEKAHELRPDDIEIGVALARRYLEQNRLAEALSATESLVENAPDDASLHRLKGLVLLASGRGDEGLASLEKAVALSPENLALRLTLAQARIALNQLDAAVRELKSIRRAHPDYVPAASMLALAQLRQGRPEAALETAESLRANEETAAASYVLAGDLLRFQGKFQAAAGAYATAFEKESTRELALRLFEVRLRSEFPKPAKSLIEWNRQNPGDIEIMMALAQWHQMTDAFDAAAELYRAVLEVEPNDLAALNNLALIYAEQDDSRALAMAERAYRIAPENPAVMDTLGWILVNQGDAGRGLSLIRQAATAAPAVPEIQYHLAVALSQSRNEADRAAAESILTALLDSQASFENRGAAKALLKTIRN